MTESPPGNTSLRKKKHSQFHYLEAVTVNTLECLFFCLLGFFLNAFITS